MEVLPKKRKFHQQDRGEAENGLVQENDSEKHVSKILPRTTGSGLSDNLSIISKQESKRIALSKIIMPDTDKMNSLKHEELFLI